MRKRWEISECFGDGEPLWEGQECGRLHLLDEDIMSKDAKKKKSEVGLLVFSGLEFLLETWRGICLDTYFIPKYYFVLIQSGGLIG